MKKVIILLLVIGFISMAVLAKYGRTYWHPIYLKLFGTVTLSQAINQIDGSVKSRVANYFSSVGFKKPPQQIALLAIKEDASLEVWAKYNAHWYNITNYPVLAASGNLGHKLVEGDKQVPEGIYKMSHLNPNSAFHLSMKINYPNADDLLWSQKEGRESPGTNIFIHGKDVSIGCLAMGDRAIEELFLMSHDVGIQNISVIISPVDPRKKPLINNDLTRPWLSARYQSITHQFLSITGNNKP